MRPYYETKADLSREILFKSKIETTMDVVLYKLPIKYSVDFCAVRNKLVVAWIEVRERTTKKHHYKDYQTGSEKMWQGVSFSEMYDIPFMLFVRFLDEDCHVKVTRSMLGSLGIEMLHLVKRNDPQDIEPCVSFPLNTLVKF